jgi:peptidoglycan/LPS O-acetylase OafA/YrhL
MAELRGVALLLAAAAAFSIVLFFGQGTRAQRTEMRPFRLFFVASGVLSAFYGLSNLLGLFPDRTAQLVITLGYSLAVTWLAIWLNWWHNTNHR